jgi:nucleotide-binding universal stress UspA family protein
MYTTIAVATDGSETAGKAVDVAVDLAARYEAELLLFTAYEPAPGQEREENKELTEEDQWRPSAHEDVDATFADATQRAAARGIEPKAIAREGEPARVICDLAEEFHTDVLVIGNKGMERRILGSVPNTVLHNAPCTVVLAKTTEAFSIATSGTRACAGAAAVRLRTPTAPAPARNGCSSGE